MSEDTPLAWLALKRADTLTASRWRNGAGSTVELFSGPDAEAPDWRLSIARIAAEAPYSDFAGYARGQVLLAGGPLTLWQDSAILAQLDAPADRVQFDGAIALRARPETPASVANTFARSGWLLNAWLRPLLGTMMLPAHAQGAWLGQVIGGQLKVRRKGESSPWLHREDAFRIDDTARPWAVLEGSGLVLLAQLQRAQVAPTG